VGTIRDVGSWNHEKWNGEVTARFAARFQGWLTGELVRLGTFERSAGRSKTWVWCGGR
jgi:hypothetical protein